MADIHVLKWIGTQIHPGLHKLFQQPWSLVQSESHLGLFGTFAFSGEKKEENLWNNPKI